MKTRVSERWLHTLCAVLFFAGPLACVLPKLEFPSSASEKPPVAAQPAKPATLEEVDPNDPDEKFAREWFSGGEYVFLVINRAKVKGVTVTKEGGLRLNEPAYPERLSYSARLLREFHAATLGALDPGRSGMSGSYWWTDRRLAAPRWDGEPPLKLARNQFYDALRASLGRQEGPKIERIQMMLTLDWEPSRPAWQSNLDASSRHKQLQASRKDPTTGVYRRSAACVVVEDDNLHMPATYLAHLAGIDAAHVQPHIQDPRSVRVLDVKLQEYFCQVDALPPKERPALFVSSGNLYREAVSRYLDRRQDAKGRLAGLDFIKQYLAATIIGTVQREPNEFNLPVGLFIEFKVRQMDEPDGGRKYVLHRLVKEEDGQCLVKALREATGLLEQLTRKASGDTFALKLKAAQQLSRDQRKRGSVRFVLRRFVESAAVLMPTYTKTALADAAPAAPPAEPSRSDDCLTPEFAQALRSQESAEATAARK